MQQSNIDFTRLISDIYQKARGRRWTDASQTDNKQPWDTLLLCFITIFYFNLVASPKKQIIFTLHPPSPFRPLSPIKFLLWAASRLQQRASWESHSSALRLRLPVYVKRFWAVSGDATRCGCTCPCNRALLVYTACDRYCSPHAPLHQANSSCLGPIVFEAQEEEPFRSERFVVITTDDWFGDH